jgi:hypothetical protein
MVFTLASFLALNLIVLCSVDRHSVQASHGGNRQCGTSVSGKENPHRVAPVTVKTDTSCANAPDAIVKANESRLSLTDHFAMHWGSISASRFLHFEFQWVYAAGGYQHRVTDDTSGLSQSKHY